MGPEGPIGPGGPEGPRGPEGPSGTTGQDAATVLGTGPLALSASSTTFSPVPGLLVVVNVPNDSVLLVSTDGGIQVGMNTANIGTLVEVRLEYDGAAGGSGSTRRYMVHNSGNFVGADTWNVAQTVALPPGIHTIAVAARLVPVMGTVVPATLSGSSGSVFQGQLSVAVIKTK
jgi:hypothetical protein